MHIINKFRSLSDGCPANASSSVFFHSLLYRFLLSFPLRQFSSLSGLWSSIIFFLYLSVPSYIPGCHFEYLFNLYIFCQFFSFFIVFFNFLASYPLIYHFLPLPYSSPSLISVFYSSPIISHLIPYSSLPPELINFSPITLSP